MLLYARMNRMLFVTKGYLSTWRALDIPGAFASIWTDLNYAVSKQICYTSTVTVVADGSGASKRFDNSLGTCK